MTTKTLPDVASRRFDDFLYSSGYSIKAKRGYPRRPGFKNIVPPLDDFEFFYRPRTDEYVAFISFGFSGDSIIARHRNRAKYNYLGGWFVKFRDNEWRIAKEYHYMRVADSFLSHEFYREHSPKLSNTSIYIPIIRERS